MRRTDAVNKLWHELLWKKFNLKYDDSWEIMSFIEDLIGHLPWDKEENIDETR